MNSYTQKPDFSHIAASNIYHFNDYDIFKRKDGIIQLQIYDGYYGELADGINIVETFKLLKGTEKCLVLIISADNASFSKEAREFVASEETSKIVMADAFVLSSLSLKILMNGYLKFNKPNRPTRFFNAEQGAIAWLNEIR
jgi:hypothetical protein